MRGSEATEPERAERARGGGCGGGVPPPTVGRFFEKSCVKMAFSCMLDTIIRGNLCSGIGQLPTYTKYILHSRRSFKHKFRFWRER